MPPNCERLLGPAGNVKTDPHRGSLPKWLRTGGIGPRAVADSWAGRGFFITGLRRLICATIAYTFLPSSDTPQ